MRRRARCLALCALLAALAPLAALPVSADPGVADPGVADVGILNDPLASLRAGAPAAEGPTAGLPSDGVGCGDRIVQSFPAVWQGHFQGGYSHYLGEGGPIVLDWRDEKRCFPSQGMCKRYVAEMRRDFHRPEGYFTCLPIR